MGMCAQCMMGAVAATSAATGTRAFLAGRVSERALRRIWAGLAMAAVAAAGLLFSA